MSILENPKFLLVTGASGFLGRRLVRHALRDGWSVRALVRHAGSSPGGAEEIVGSLEDVDQLQKACSGVTAVVHTAGLAHIFGTAAKKTAKFMSVNAHGTETLARAATAAGVSHLILASSVSVYGTSANSGPCDEDTPCFPVSPYAKSKYQAELLATKIVTGTATGLTILRFVTIYGEGDRGNVARLCAAIAGGRFIMPGNGENRKSLIYCGDAADACLAALRTPPRDTSIYNVSSGEATMQEIVSAICAALGRPLPKTRIPAGVLLRFATLSRRFGDPYQFSARLLKFLHDDVYAGRRFEQACEFAAVIPLVEGLRRETIAMIDAQKLKKTPSQP